ncbi:MAG: type II toxin-antitoxin system HicA family toxin [Pyrinomonadaceae bacterium]
MKVREIIKIIENDGWYLKRAKRSHRQFKHPIKNGTVTIAGHERDTIHPKTESSILKQARLK